MAFMMPVVKKDWEIYPNKPIRSRKSSTTNNPGKGLTNNKSSMGNISPPIINEFVPPSVIAYQRSESTDSTDSNNDPMPPIPKSASSLSFTNFHTRLVEKIRKISRSNRETDSEITTDVAAPSST